MKRNIAGFILSGLMVVLFAGCGGAPFPETTTLDGVTYTVIAKESDFDKMRTDLTGNYYLWRDVALTGDFDPIGDSSDPFTGIFEGNNKTISNLRIAKSGENYVGFFGQIGVDGASNPDANGVVRNLTLELTAGTVDAPSIEGADYVGVLAGISHGKIEAVGVEGGFVKGTDYVGGLVGETYGDITSSYATGSVKGGFYVGGLVGYFAGGTITSSYATGSVEGINNAGGLVGVANGTITSSYATGSVTLTGTGSNVGGLLGANSQTITSSYFDSSTEGTNQTNGIGQDITNQSVTGYDTSTYILQRTDFAADWIFDGDDAVWRWVADGQWPLLAWQLEQ